MATLFGFVIFCCVAWWWVRGNGFVAFVVALALCGLVTIGAGETTHTPILLRYLVVLMVACLPHYLRTGGLAPGRERISGRVGVRSDTPQHPRISG